MAGAGARGLIVDKTWPEYIAMRILITFMRDLPWLCLGYFFIVFSLGGVAAIRHPVSLVIEALGAIEILFFVLFYLPYKAYLQTHKPYKAPPMTRAQRAALIYKSLDLVPDMESFIRKWSNNAHMEDIRKDNVKDWLLWALFEVDGTKGEATGMEVNAELEQYIQEAEARLAHKFKPGRGSAETIRLCFDPILIQHRALLFYLIIGMADTAMCLWFLLRGFRFYRPALSNFFAVFPLRFVTLLPFHKSAAPNMSYWCRPHRSKTKRPIVFIHGLGTGLIPYVFWLNSIPKDVGFLAIEMLPVSGRIAKSLAPTPELCDMIASCIAQQRAENPSPATGQPGAWDDFVLIGNSYGTLLMGPLLQRPEVSSRVAASILIDPVSLLLHLPDVAYNFTRREPRPSIRGRPGHGNEWEIWWASSTDACTAYTLARRFCWRESIMWREMLMPSLRGAEAGAGVGSGAPLSSVSSYGVKGTMRSTVILGGEDCVTAPKEVASYVFSGNATWTPADLEDWKNYQWTGREELELLFLDGADHGQGIMVFKTPDRITRVIEEYCRRDDGFAVIGDFYRPTRNSADDGAAWPKSPIEDGLAGIELDRMKVADGSKEYYQGQI